jgi:DNA-directed RNA polymerase subunit F
MATNTSAKGQRPASKKGTGRKQTPVNKTSNRGTTKGIEIVPDGKYPLIRISDISFPPRPEPGKEQDTDDLFYNARPLEEVMNPEKMAKLIYSIRLEDLLEPLAVNVVTAPGDRDTAVKIELLAGERRNRALTEIIKHKLPCVDEVSQKPECFKAGAIVNWKNRFGKVVKQDGDKLKVAFDDHLNEIMGSGEQEVAYADVLPTVPGDEKHKYVACKVYYDLPVERKMRINFSENDNSEPLSVKAEVDLVERLIRRGKKQAEIAFILDTNITFVSQRASFREQLPKVSFDLLMEGKMSANVAVNILSMKPEDRESYVRLMIDIEKSETDDKIRILRAEAERLEDEAELHRDEAAKARKNGDEATAAKEEKKANSAEAKATKARERKTRTEAESGTIKQGHAHRAAATGGMTPRKAKMLPKEQIEELYFKGMAKFSGGGELDPICGEEIPGEYAAIMRRTAKAILDGVLDPLAVIRDYMVGNDLWRLPTETAAQKANKPKAKGGRRPKDEDEEEEEEEEEDRLNADYDEGEEEEDEIGEPSPEELVDEDGFDSDDRADEDDDDDDDRPRRRKRRRGGYDDDVGARLDMGARMLGED